MSYLNTDGGYDMYEMLSMLQKSIRRGDYQHAGFAANQLKRKFRTAMWNRIFVIGAEDCFGVITKELVALRKADDIRKDDTNIGNSVALLCKSLKSRDACYFSCNFVLASRRPRILDPSQGLIDLYTDLANGIEPGDDKKKRYDEFGFVQLSLFEEAKEPEQPKRDLEYGTCGAKLHLAISHRDMDMIGFQMDVLRNMNREFLWKIFQHYASDTQTQDEIAALKEADNYVNAKRSSKDEIFISKAAMLLCYADDPTFKTVRSSDFVDLSKTIDWSKIEVMPIDQCRLADGKVPEWVYDCHTLKGKKMGKTDWEMTVTEQAALNPLQKAYFDEASWLYTYEQDVENGVMTEAQMEPIREFAKTHEVNPVKYLPYEE